MVDPISLWEYMASMSLFDRGLQFSIDALHTRICILITSFGHGIQFFITKLCIGAWYSYYLLTLWNSVFLPKHLMDFTCFITTMLLLHCLEPFQFVVEILAPISYWDEESSNMLRIYIFVDIGLLILNLSLSSLLTRDIILIILHSQMHPHCFLLIVPSCYCLDFGFLLIYACVWLSSNLTSSCMHGVNVYIENWLVVLDLSNVDT